MAVTLITLMIHGHCTNAETQTPNRNTTTRRSYEKLSQPVFSASIRSVSPGVAAVGESRTISGSEGARFGGTDVNERNLVSLTSTTLAGIVMALIESANDKNPQTKVRLNRELKRKVRLSHCVRDVGNGCIVPVHSGQKETCIGPFKL